MDRLYAPWRMAYIDQPSRQTSSSIETGCIFCDKPKEDQDERNLIVYRGEHAYVLLNLFPYNNGHIMVAPYQHTALLPQLEPFVLLEIMTLAQKAQKALDLAFRPEGYNMGMNLGNVAGAGIADHLHLHLVPRWSGDTNFMPVLADVKVLPDALESSCRKIREAWQSLPIETK